MLIFLQDDHNFFEELTNHEFWSYEQIKVFEFLYLNLKNSVIVHYWIFPFRL